MDLSLIFFMFFILLFCINGSTGKKTINEIHCMCGFLLILVACILFINRDMIESNCNRENFTLGSFNLSDIRNNPGSILNILRDNINEIIQNIQAEHERQRQSLTQSVQVPLCEVSPDGYSAWRSERDSCNCPNNVTPPHTVEGGPNKGQIVYRCTP